MNLETKHSKEAAKTSFYNLKMKQANGNDLEMDELKNKKLLLVNTASDCGYTFQYEGLQKLHEQFKDQLTIIGFPSNDFGQQEKADDDTIAQFCTVNFGVTFPLVAKSAVKKGEAQNEVFEWLSNKDKNGWNDTAPTWNFCKYLIDEKGNLTHFFEAAIGPDDPKLLAAIG